MVASFLQTARCATGATEQVKRTFHLGGKPMFFTSSLRGALRHFSSLRMMKYLSWPCDVAMGIPLYACEKPVAAKARDIPLMVTLPAAS
jgi:hypothetical protein